jgi:hypothetical protein
MSIKRLTALNSLVLSTPPSNPKVGDFYVNSSNYHVYVYNGSTWVDSSGSGGGSGSSAGAKYTYATSAPTSGNTVGDRWLNSNNGAMLTYVNDGTSTQWVELSVQAASTGILGTLGTMAYADTVNYPLTSTLGTGAYANISNYATLSNPTFVGKVTADSLAITSGTANQFLKGNGSVDTNTYLLASGGVQHESLSFTLSANTATAVDTTPISSFTSISYIVSIKQGAKARTSQFNVGTNGTIVTSVEYGAIATGTTLTGFAISATAVSGNMNLNITISDAATTNATIKLNKVLM